MKIISYSISETLSIGRTIAKNIKRGDIVCLFGQLGSGKTILTKGIALGLGINKNTIISPSFVLIRQYNKGKLTLYHLDLYRLKHPLDILLLGYEEYLYADGITVIEWADRLKYLLPKEYLKIELSVQSDKQRSLEFNALGRHYKEALDNIYENIRH